MIRYSLACTHGHAFEGWFPSSDAYDTQARRKLITCATCGSHDVAKALMAPSIAGTRQNKQPDKAAPKRTRTRKQAVLGPEAIPVPMVANDLPVSQKQLLDAMRELRKQVEANAEYVGPKFADEARKIHHEEAPARGIYGEATPEEAKALHEEGVSVYPLPILPEEKN